MHTSLFWTIPTIVAMTYAIPTSAQTLGRGSANPSSNRAWLVYVGTFTWKDSKGIYLMQLDPATGTLSRPELVVEAPSPSFLALHPNHRFLYSVNEVETFDGNRGGGVSAFAIDRASGKLTVLNQQPSGGTSPTHITIDSQGRNLLVANYGSGSVVVLPIEDDGKLGPPSSTDQHKGRGTDPQRQEGPHAHCANLDPANRYALSCDLGLDKVFVYQFDAAKHAIAPGDPPTAGVAPASGPRHLAFRPDGKFIYVVTEMGCTVIAFAYDSDRGVLRQVQSVSTLADDFGGEKSGAEIMVHPSGKFLYCSNRGAANNIAAFRIDPDSGKLTPVRRVSTQGKAPRSFGIDPTGTWLLVGNQDTSNVVVFRIDPETGELKPNGVSANVPTPVSFAFLPAGQ